MAQRYLYETLFTMTFKGLWKFTIALYEECEGKASKRSRARLRAWLTCWLQERYLENANSVSTQIYRLCKVNIAFDRLTAAQMEELTEHIVGIRQHTQLPKRLRDDPEFEAFARDCYHYMWRVPGDGFYDFTEDDEEETVSCGKSTHH